MSEVLIFPVSKSAEAHLRRSSRVKPTQSAEAFVKIHLAAIDTQLLDQFAATLGISRDDAAGRVLRHALRLRATQGGAA